MTTGSTGGGRLILPPDTRNNARRTQPVPQPREIHSSEGDYQHNSESVVTENNRSRGACKGYCRSNAVSSQSPLLVRQAWPENMAIPS